MGFHPPWWTLLCSVSYYLSVLKRYLLFEKIERLFAFFAFLRFSLHVKSFLFFFFFLKRILAEKKSYLLQVDLFVCFCSYAKYSCFSIVVHFLFYLYFISVLRTCEAKQGCLESLNVILQLNTITIINVNLITIITIFLIGAV